MKTRKQNNAQCTAQQAQERMDLGLSSATSSDTSDTRQKLQTARELHEGSRMEVRAPKLWHHSTQTKEDSQNNAQVTQSSEQHCPKLKNPIQYITVQYDMDSGKYGTKLKKCK